MPYQPRGSGFIGLQQYLNANRGAAQEMGSRVAGQVETAGQAAQAAVDAQQKELEAQIAAGTPTADTNTWGLEPDEVAAKRAAGMGATYTGPAGMEVSEGLNRQVSEAQRQAQLAGTDAGRSVLLRQGAPAGPYTTGQSMLDSFLVGRGAGERLDKAAARFGNLRAYLGSAQKGVAGKVGAAQEEAKRVQGVYGAMPTPTYAAPAPPAPPPAPGQPYVDNAKRVEDENKWKARMGIRG